MKIIPTLSILLLPIIFIVNVNAQSPTDKVKGVKQAPAPTPTPLSTTLRGAVPNGASAVLDKISLGTSREQVENMIQSAGFKGRMGEFRKHLQEGEHGVDNIITITFKPRYFSGLNKSATGGYRKITRIFRPATSLSHGYKKIATSIHYIYTHSAPYVNGRPDFSKFNSICNDLIKKYGYGIRGKKFCTPRSCQWQAILDKERENLSCGSGPGTGSTTLLEIKYTRE